MVARILWLGGLGGDTCFTVIKFIIDINNI